MANGDLVVMDDRLQMAVNNALVNSGMGEPPPQGKRGGRRSSLTERMFNFGGGGGYNGSFKVIDVSDAENIKVKVCDGANPESNGVCGLAVITGKRFEVPAKEFEVKSGGYILLISEYDDSAKTPKTPEMKFVTAIPAHNEAVALILIARIGFINNSLTIIQEQHGMAKGEIWGDCEDK